MLKRIIMGVCVFSALQSSRVALEHRHEGQRYKIMVSTRSSVPIKEILEAADVSNNKSLSELIDNSCTEASKKRTDYEVIMIQGAKL